MGLVMDENALGFASYWRNSLADAESGKGSFERKDAKISLTGMG